MGEFPMRPLGEVSDNYDSLRVPVKAADRKPGPFPYYGAQGIVDYVDDYLFDGEYILIAEDGENLRSRNEDIALIARGKFWVNNHAHIIRGNDEADTKFIYYALNSTDISGHITGSTIPKLSQRNLNVLRLPLPQLPEQRAIASVLSALDDKIEVNRRMNEVLEAQARALFKDWFVDFGPTRTKMAMRGEDPGHANTPAKPYLPPDLWTLFPDHLDENGKPEGWEESEIGNEAKVVGGSTPSTKEPRFWGGSINWVTPKDLSTLKAPILIESNRTITKAGLEKISSGLLPAGTVLLSSRAPIGYVAIAAIPLAINQGFIALRCEGRVSNVYVWLWLHENMEAIKGNANGSTFQEISKKNFRPLPVIVPSVNVMDAFNEMVIPLYDRIEKNERESRNLAQTRDLLLPKLMSGEIRVRDAEKQIGEVVV